MSSARILCHPAVADREATRPPSPPAGRAQPCSGDDRAGTRYGRGRECRGSAGGGPDPDLAVGLSRDRVRDKNQGSSGSRGSDCSESRPQELEVERRSPAGGAGRATYPSSSTQRLAKVWFSLYALWLGSEVRAACDRREFRSGTAGGRCCARWRLCDVRADRPGWLLAGYRSAMRSRSISLASEYSVWLG